MKVVIDTNVIASAMFFGGKPEKLVDLLLRGGFDAYVNEGIIAEYVEITAELKAGYPNKALRYALPNILSKMHQIDAVAEVRVCRDPDDDKFVGCAIDSKSKYIVSGDKDLLSLGNYKDVEIVAVADFLHDNFPDE